MKSKVTAAIDLGGTKIAIGLVKDERVIVRHELPTLPDLGFEHALDRMRPILEKLGHFDAIGIASTGPIDRETGVFGQVDTLPGWKGSNLRKALEPFGVPIVIENDADAAALAEAGGCSRFLYVTISTGIGGGLILDGRIYRGVGGAHPEIGHHMLEAFGPACPCGGRGCWEILASGTAMASRGLTAEQICASSEDWAQEIVAREGYYLGSGVANLANMFAPEVIALGGGVMKSAPLFLERIRQIVRLSVTMVPVPEIRLAKLGVDAGLIGASKA